MKKMKISRFTKDCIDLGIYNIVLFSGGNASCENTIPISATMYTNHGFTKHDVRIRALTVEAGLLALIEKAKEFKRIDEKFCIQKEDHCGDDPNAYAHIKSGNFEIVEDFSNVIEEKKC